MPNEVIEQVRRLAIAAETYKRIIFTNTQGNILTNQGMDDDTTIKEAEHTLEEIMHSTHNTEI